MSDALTSDVLQDLQDHERAAVDILARDYAARASADGFSAENFFGDLRRRIEARASTLRAVAEDGPMGGGGPGEA